ncbi:protein 60A-like isoform X2 [Ischnura elegans]|uniref:protein 60A-like isoform X2 n=1 Tax=Ischnura elegans TaxID=197161 RepID=UPI001ED8779F|nr:protein 60A-like isoform X2 [Ischnura elegans]
MVVNAFGDQSCVPMARNSCVLLAQCLAGVLLLSAVCASPSGLYVDNGLDSTVMHRSLSAREKQEVEHEILNLLGLPNRPQPKRRIANSARRGVGGSAPQFLLGLYEALGDEGLESAAPGLSLSGADIGAIDESDTIISFRSHGDPSWTHHSRKGWDIPLRHERGRRLWFDVSEVPIEEAIVAAELRLFRKGLRPICNHANHAFGPLYHEPTSFNVTVHQVVSKGASGAGRADGTGTLQLLDSVEWSSENEGWILINVTGALAAWVRYPETNLGLHLSVSSNSHELHPEDVGIVGPPVGYSGRGPQSSKEPFLVAFLGSSVLPTRTVGVHSRSTREVKKRRRNRQMEPSKLMAPRNPLLEPPGLWSSRSCQIKTLYVSFRDLEWQDWIIAPDGYGAFFCSGECNFPLNSHMNATNHAIVQTLVHLMKPSEVPKPCCAPTKLTPISVLYFLDDSNVILKKYKNMVVKSCGCH